MGDKQIDFLRNDDFILWQLTGDRELEARWQAYIADNPSAREELEAAIRKFSGLRLTSTVLSDSESAGLRQRIHTSVARQAKKQRIRRLIQYAAAACLIAAFAGTLHYNYTRKEKENVVQEMNDLVIPSGKRSQLELSDGTKVWLNSGSVLKFPTTFQGKTRNVYLVGEMYAEVAKDPDKPFLVHTPDFQVKVYGTRLNISAYHDNRSQSVVLVEGSVGVKTETEKETLLAPNDMLVRHNKHWDKKEVDVREYVSWKDGYMLLNHTPIDRVLQRMERYYNLSFTIQDTTETVSRTCTGKIYLSENPEDVLAAISLLYSIRYTRNENMISIHYEPLNR
ncbi:MAG: FecR domain-containing protein [Tannerellaceae bacterium]|jgi:ferric-dicitrate binding protein FerR (iron transport regulator)|nr:FecR domain-containing protein [Tannerellaceae bacterium]